MRSTSLDSRIFVSAVVAAVVLALAPGMAAAETQWSFKQMNGHPYLLGFSGTYEGDNDFWALCRSAGAVDLGAGANSGVGRGKGEKVMLLLSSAGRSAALAGQSRRSRDFELTGGTELRTTVSTQNSVFAVLRTGEPIKIGGSIEKPANWSASGLKAALEAFLGACRKIAARERGALTLRSSNELRSPGSLGF